MSARQHCGAGHPMSGTRWISPAFWGSTLLVALFWPSRFVGPADGAPLDQRVEVVLLAGFVPALWYLCPAFLRTRFARATLGTLAVWKIATLVLVAQTGWGGLVASKYGPPLDSYRVERSWDARTFLSGAPPPGHAVGARPYPFQLAHP